MPSSWPSPRSSRSTSASSNPSVVSTSACESARRGLGQLLLRPRHEQAVRLLRTAPDPAAELVQLGEAEAVGLLDDHHRRVRDVDADLDHRRRDEHVELPRLEPRHQVAPVGRLQPAVQAADAEPAQLRALQPRRLLLRRARPRRLRLLDQRADDVRLPALAQQARQPPVRLRARAPRSSAVTIGRRRRRRLRDLADRPGRRRRSARACAGSASRSCAARAGTRPSTSALRCSTPKRCCSSTTATATFARSTPSWISACVPTRIDAPAAASRAPLADRAGQQAAGDAELAAELLDGEEVLLGERLGRRHQRALVAALDRAQQRVQRDHRLPRADVALEQPLHRHRPARGRGRSRRSPAPGARSASNGSAAR